MATSNGKNIFWWVGAAAFLIITSIAVAPRLLGKRVNTVTPTLPVPTPAGVKAMTSPGYDYGVANSQYGHALRNYNFAGLAIEAPTNVMPLGFHLNNVM